VNELLRIDARVSLPDDLLMVADLCSMYESVELRVPFLDLAFVELAERMPSRYKIGLSGNRKWLYREAAAARLPTETSRRLGRTGSPLRRKRGFSPPRAGRAPGVPEPSYRDPGWLAPLLALDAFDAKQLRLAASDSGEGHRRRSVLQALSGWLMGQDA
jgi:hypothetical protein